MMHLPRRRYAIFAGLFRDYAVVITGDDIERAPSWGGFIRWFGGEKPAITLNVRSPRDAQPVEHACHEGA